MRHEGSYGQGTVIEYMQKKNPRQKKKKQKKKKKRKRKGKWLQNEIISRIYYVTIYEKIIFSFLKSHKIFARSRLFRKLSLTCHVQPLKIFGSLRHWIYLYIIQSVLTIVLQFGNVLYRQNLSNYTVSFHVSWLRET